MADFESTGGDGTSESLVFEMPAEVSVDGPPAPSAPSSSVGWFGKAFAAAVVLLIAGGVFVSIRSSSADEQLLFVPTDMIEGQGRVGDIYWASLDEMRTDENRLLGNVSASGELTSFLGDGEVEVYESFGMEYEDGHLFTYQQGDTSNVVLAHLKDGELTEMASADYVQVFQSDAGLFAFLDTDEGCEAVGFVGLEVEPIASAGRCLPSEQFLYLVNFDSPRRTVSRYDVASRDLTEVAQDEGTGRITVSADGTVLVMTRYPSVDDGLQPPASDAEIDVYRVGSNEALDVDIDDSVEDGTRSVVRVLNDAVVVATFSRDGGSLLYVPVDGGPAIEVGETTFGLVISNPSEDAALIPGFDSANIINFEAEPEMFEAETDGFETATWVDSDTIIWVDEAGVVRVGSTDGTTTIVGEIGPWSIHVPRWENGRLILSVQDNDLNSTQYLYSEADGLVEVGASDHLTAFDGPGDSTIGVSFDASSFSTAVGMLDSSTGALDIFDDSDTFLRRFLVDGSIVSYSSFGEDFDDVATRVADLSDPTSIEVEVYEGVVLLSGMPTSSRWEWWQGSVQQ